MRESYITNKTCKEVGLGYEEAGEEKGRGRRTKEF